MSNPRVQLSVLLPTFNNEQNIRDCLESIKWADEILVVDSFSTDRTLEIAREYGARIIEHEYVNSAAQKNWAIPQCAHEWVLQIDTDERLEEGAREEIERQIGQASDDVYAFRLARKNHILGKWVKDAGLYPDYQRRLFRREMGRFEKMQVHAHLTVPGKVITLQHHLLHNGMPTLSKPLSNLDRYTSYQAREWRANGRRFNYLSLLFRPLGAFVVLYFLRAGFRAGWRGYLIAARTAIYSLMTHAKLWELEWQNGERR